MKAMYVLLPMILYFSTLILTNVLNSFVVIETFGKSRVTQVLQKGHVSRSRSLVGKEEPDLEVKFGTNKYLIEVGDKLETSTPVRSTIYTERGYTVMVQDIEGIEKHMVSIYYGPMNVILPSTYKGFGIGSDNLEKLRNAIWWDLCLIASLIQTILILCTMYVMKDIILVLNGFTYYQ